MYFWLSITNAHTPPDFFYLPPLQMADLSILHVLQLVHFMHDYRLIRINVLYDFHTKHTRKFAKISQINLWIWGSILTSFGALFRNVTRIENISLKMFTDDFNVRKARFSQESNF